VKKKRPVNIYTDKIEIHISNSVELPVIDRVTWSQRENDLKRKEGESHQTHHERLNGLVHWLDNKIKCQLEAINQLEEEVIPRVEGLLETQISDNRQLARDKATLMRRVNELKSNWERSKETVERQNRTIDHGRKTMMELLRGL